ncbi:MAG: DUF4368 domain-containing protein [Clostridia bacterium]|nr:DUF4368 domain-containing protein [Clostridia bacterium]
MKETRRVPRRDDRAPNIFAGLLYCADCGNKLYVHRNSKDDKYGSYMCPSYRKPVIKECTSHHISRQIIYDIVLEDLQLKCSYIADHEKEFVEKYRERVLADMSRDRQFSETELKKAQTRIAEIDGIIKKLYEDNVSGRISDERFDSLSLSYETEQKALKAKVESLQTDARTLAREDENLAKFIRLVKKYSDITELNTEILNAFIDKIYIGETVRTPKGKTREIRIIYKFIGAVSL